MGKIKVFATDENGDGHTIKIGEYEDLEDIEIRVGMFADNIVISFVYEEIED